MDMIVVFGALFVGLAAATLGQVAVFYLNIKNEMLVVLGAFGVGMLASAPFIAKLLGV